MSWKFTSINQYASLAGQSWVNGASKLSLSARIRMDTQESPAKEQYALILRGSSGYFGLRFDDDGTIKSTIYTGGVYRTATGPAFAVGTIYHVVVTWDAGVTNGLKIYIDGVLYAQTTPTGQTAIQIGDVTLRLNAYGSASNFGRSTLEDVLIVRDYLVTADEALALHHGVPPQALPLAAYGYSHWQLWGELLTRAPDLSGAYRAIETVVGAIDGGAFAPRREYPGIFAANMATDVPSAGAGPPAENPWVEWTPTVAHPTAEAILTGLTVGTTYRVKVRAQDAAGNVSADSAVVEVTPQEFIRHEARSVLLFTR